MDIGQRWKINLLLLGGTVMGAACGGASRVPAESTPVPAPSSMEALYRARLDSAMTRFTPADVHFMTGMISHHAQALVMARWAESHGASSSIRTLAARITNAQRDEIATMQAWLRDREQPVPEVEITDQGMMIRGGHAMRMPGMLTDVQMAELEKARGAEFDRLFLTFMIQHHQGAVTMVHELFATDGAGQDEAVFKFASDVQVDQTTEIARMEIMLGQLGDRR
jgi:uncharacterized protein (DUF305 family)